MMNNLIEIDGKEIEFKCYQDGNAWCCVGPDFEDLAVSDAAFGDTRDEAIEAFAQMYVCPSDEKETT
jgi:hypothetical protein